MMQKNPELTKLKLINAFLDLYEEKPIEKISIGELTTKAEIYRGTFYYYYKDIYDLLNVVESEFVTLTLQIAYHIIEGIFAQNIETKVPKLLSYYQQNERQIQVFLIKRPNPLFLRKMKEAGKKIALARLGVSDEHLTVRAAYIAEYIASAQLGLITKWLENGQDISPKELVTIMQAVNLNGPITCLLEENSTNNAVKAIQPNPGLW
jgi:AcrR family transcriptional regulator